MKKILIPILILAVIFALKVKDDAAREVYLTIIGIAVFMFGMMRLSAKTPSKNKDKEDQNVQ